MMGSIITAQLLSLLFGYNTKQFNLSHSASFNAGILIGWVPLVLAPIVEEISWHGCPPVAYEHVLHFNRIQYLLGYMAVSVSLH
ncbi:hypothetical protein U2P60_03465 [Brucella sp. H1_1004]|uniref:hypothetical protein n=1 Tax=Brucella sp. H1_1004 TaxID=3110109 RepID=UPI0039B54A7C